MNEPQADHLPLPDPSEGVLDRALALVEFLRARCPWDAAQTPRTLRRYLLEEAHEVVDAIDRGDDAELQGELGDLLLNLAFQIVIGEERAAFDREGVVRELEEKMRRRHPHVYAGADAVSWERLKAQERGAQATEPRGLLADLTAGADPLEFAYKVQARVASVGFDWADSFGAWEKVREEVDEVRDELTDAGSIHLEEEIGDLLFAVVNLARLSNVHPTMALARANAKFARRFARLEAIAGERGVVLENAGLDALDRLWDEVKGEEK